MHNSTKKWLFTKISSLALIPFIIWFIIKTVIGIRASKDDEEYGLDLSELGSMGYPEFTKK